MALESPRAEPPVTDAVRFVVEVDTRRERAHFARVQLQPFRQQVVEPIQRGFVQDEGGADADCILGEGFNSFGPGGQRSARNGGGHDDGDLTALIEDCTTCIASAVVPGHDQR